nr:hypothetical protein [Polymorphobacter sp.]
MTPRFLASALALAAAAVLGACAQSPLYDGKAVAGGTHDEVPRDGNGEPMLGAVRPIPAGSLALAQPKP